MKKYILLVLILIMLVGIFSPMTQVHASAYSDCIAFESSIGEPDLRSCDGLEGDPNAAASTVADACKDIEGIGNIICQIHKILNLIIPALIALAIIYFIWGVVQYVIRDSEEAKKKGKGHIIYGLIGLAIIVSLWGVVGIFVQSFGLGGGTTPTLTTPTEDGASICPSLPDLHLPDNPK